MKELKMLDMLNGLEKISQAVGIRPDYVQGGGGNTSVKLDKTLMAIKASGTLLSELTSHKGFSIVDYPSVKALLTQNMDNDTFANATNALVSKSHQPDSTARPSIETGFHALLGKFVIHTHSVYANILTCSEQGEGICKQLFPQAAWISYLKPGLELTHSINDALSSKTFNTVFLQNHGLIVTGKSAEEAIQLHHDVNNKLINALRLPMWSQDLERIDRVFMQEHVIFPDQVVYLNNGQLLNTQAGKDTTRAYEYIFHVIHALGYKVRYLSELDKRELLGMKSEKYRQSVAK